MKKDLREFRVIKQLEFKTDSRRRWEEINVIGDNLAVTQNDVKDLQIMLERKGSEQDIIDIPPIAFGGQQITIKFHDRMFNRIFMNHSAFSGGKIRFVVGGQSSYDTLSGGAIIIDGYFYDDFDQLAFNAAGGVEVSYVVGTNANAAVTTSPLRWPLGVLVKKTRFYATQPFAVRFDNAASVQHLFAANTFYEIMRGWSIIYVIGSGLNAGNLDIWIEG